MTTTTETVAALQEFVMKELLQRGDVTFSDEVHLVHDGYLDSLQTVQLALFLEERFNVEVDPEDITEDNFRNFGTIASLVERKLGNA